jgi:protein-tyrosine phosphatase
LDLFWIEDGLAVATRPRGGDWLAGDLAAAREAGVDVLVSCLMPEEASDLGLAAERSEAAAAGLEFVEIPIEDRGVPDDRREFEVLIARLERSIGESRRVAVHCRQGSGRSPLVVAALLIRLGRSPDAAWSVISERRGFAVPETAEQRDWIEGMSTAQSRSS